VLRVRRGGGRGELCSRCIASVRPRVSWRWLVPVGLLTGHAPVACGTVGLRGSELPPRPTNPFFVGYDDDELDAVWSVRPFCLSPDLLQPVQAAGDRALARTPTHACTAHSRPSGLGCTLPQRLRAPNKALGPLSPRQVHTQVYGAREDPPTASPE